jgi:hypothetical protein
MSCPDANNYEHYFQHSTTSHNIIFEDTFVNIGVKHSKCVPKDSYKCKSIDVVLNFECPAPNKKNVALNVTKSFELRTGDSASTFGYIYDEFSGTSAGRFFTGTLAGKLGYSSEGYFNEDEYVLLFQDIPNINGMSGGATVNDLGYVGMFHVSEYRSSAMFGTDEDDTTVPFKSTSVIPFKSIRECILESGQDESVHDKWHHWQECQHLKVVELRSLF